MITPRQIRSARAMLGITQVELAQLVGLSTTGLHNIEKGNADPKASTLKSIEHILTSAGIEFINEERGEGVVRLRFSTDK